MRSVNNKYQIESEIEDDENFTKYVVSDISKGKKSILYILKNTFTYEKIREYILRNFKSIKSYNFKNLVNLLRFEVIYSIDGIKLERQQYGYLTEYDKNIIETRDYLSKCNSLEKLNVFMQVCAIVNTLNIKGYMFDELSVKDIIIIKKPNDTIVVKLKDLLQNEIKKFNVSRGYNNLSLYLESNDKQINSNYQRSNIIQIIALFKSLFKSKELSEDLKEIEDIEKIYSQADTINKYSTIQSLIEYINEKMKKNYIYFFRESLNTITTDLDLIGLDEEIKIVENYYNSIIENKESYKIIGFNGDRGVGKTKLLHELKERFNNKYFKKVIYIQSYDTEEEKREHYEREFQKMSDIEITHNYELYVRKFMSLCIKNESSIDKIQMMQLVNRVGKFVSEYAKKTPLIIIIDDLEKKNDMFKMLLRYIGFLGKNIENSLIIFSMNESECNKEFLSYIKELKSLKEYEEYRINYFNEYNTTTMIKKILKTNNNLSRLCEKIYSETIGNPQYIKCTIEELYNKKILFFNFTTHRWEINININNILVPGELEKRIEENLALVNCDEIDVLRKLSVFRVPLPQDIILDYLLVSKNESDVYNNLKEKRYLIEKISDQGVLIGFNNNLLRNILYIKIINSDKIKSHENACKIIKIAVERSDYYKDEYIYHLERSNNIDEMHICCKKYSKEQEDLGNFKKSIKYLKLILKYYSDKRAIQAAISIAKNYDKISNHEKSYKYFLIAQNIAEKNDNYKILLYIKLEMLIIKINSNSQIDLSIENELREIRKRLLEIDYPLAEAYYYYALSLKYRLEYDHKLTLKNCLKAMDICDSNNINGDIYGWILITVAITYISFEDYIEADKYASKAIESFTKSNNKNGSIYSQLVYTAIIKSQGEDTRKVLNKYFELNKLSCKYKVIKREILCLCRIADIYFEDEDYKNAELYWLKALKRQRDEEIDCYSITICNSLCSLYIKTGQIRNVIKYYYLTRQMQRGIKLTEDEVINTNATSALYNSMICNYINGYDYLEAIYSFVKNSKRFQKKNIECCYFELKLYVCSNEEEIKEVYKNLIYKLYEFKKQNFELTFKLRVIKKLYNLGYIEFSKECFSEIEEYPENHNAKGLYTYLELCFKDKNDYETIINKAINDCKNIADLQLKADLYYLIGKKYSELNNYLDEVNYYYESIKLYIDIINSLPKVDRFIYINNSDFLNIRKSFINTIRNNLNVNIKYSDYLSVKNTREVNELLQGLSLENLFQNKELYNIAEKIYEKNYNNQVKDIYQVFENFSGDILTNLKNILVYLSKITLCDKAMIITENSCQEDKVICSYGIDKNEELLNYFLLKHELEDDIVVIANNDFRFEKIKESILNNSKSCLYMKLKNKYSYTNSSIAVNAKLILIANSAINNINLKSKNIIEKFRPFLTFLLEKYNLTIDSTLDKLTSVYNRKYFEESLRTLIDTSIVEKSRFALIMIDVDDFKWVNDKYGHQTGDEVLVKVTREAKRSLRKTDIIGRYGGEEFIILLPNCNEENAMSIAERVRINIESAKILGEKRKVTVSVGISISSAEKINGDKLIERADQALYKAKQSGKNRCVLWEGESTNTSGISNMNNELSGVITGNLTKDYSVFSVIMEITKLVKYEENSEDKMYKFIVKLMKVIECDSATIFMVRDEKIINIYSKEVNKEGWYITETYNLDLVEKIIKEKKGKYLVDWDSMNKYNVHGIPDWKSLCIVPVLLCGKVLGVIYLSASVNKKEFNFNEFNLLNYFAGISVPIFIL